MMQSRSKGSVVHFSMTIVGVGDCLDSAFLDAIERFSEDPSATIFGEVEWSGDGRFGDFKVAPVKEEDQIPEMVLSMFGAEEAEA